MTNTEVLLPNIGKASWELCSMVRIFEKSGITDQFLNSYGEEEKIDIMSVFTWSSQQKENEIRRKPNLEGTTVSSALNHACLAFRSKFWRDPTLDVTWTWSVQIKGQLRGYKREDGAKFHQRRLPLQVHQCTIISHQKIRSWETL